MAITKPTFPIVGVGSAILGLLLALTPNVFATALMYIIGGILILGAINQFMNLLSARSFGKIGFGYWISPDTPVSEAHIAAVLNKEALADCYLVNQADALPDPEPVLRLCRLISKEAFPCSLMR